MHRVCAQSVHRATQTVFSSVHRVCEESVHRAKHRVCSILFQTPCIVIKEFYIITATLKIVERMLEYFLKIQF